MKRVKALVLGMTTMALLWGSGQMAASLFKSRAVTKVNAAQEREFTIEELKKYDGSKPDWPIYLAYNGKVYDVTAGRKFYEIGGAYHWLAGRDSSVELAIAGGGLIEKKYPIIGKLIK